MTNLRVFLILLAASSSVMAADMRKSSVSDDSEVRLGLGYLKGKSSAFFYDVDGTTYGTPDYEIREVDWKLDNVLMAGAGYSLGVGDSLRFNVDYWVNAADGDTTTDYYFWGVPGNDWSEHSSHESANVSSAEMIDLSGEYVLSTSGRRGVKSTWTVVAGYRRDYFDMEASGGSGTATTTTFRDTSLAYPDTPVYSYQQTFTVPYLGFRYTSVTRTRRDKYEVRFIALYSMWATGDDVLTDHVDNWKDETEASEGEWYRIGLEMDFVLTRNMMLTLGYSQQKYKEFKGTLLNTNTSNNSTALYPNESGGMSNTTDLLFLGLNYRF